MHAVRALDNFYVDDGIVVTKKISGSTRNCN